MVEAVMFVQVVGVCFVYAMFYYLSNKISDPNHIEWHLLGATMLVGIGAGVVQAFTSIIPSYNDWLIQFAAYAVYIAALDQIILRLWDRYHPAAKQQSDAIRKGLDAKTGKPAN